MSTDTLWCGLAAADDKLYLQSGEFTSTIKTSRDVNSIDGYPDGISSDLSNNTLWSGHNDQKLYLMDGQIGNLTDSVSVSSIDASSQGISCDKNGDYIWVGVEANKLYLQSGMTSTVKTSLACPGGENGYGCSMDENEDTLLMRSQVQDKLYLLSGEFTSTIKTSLAVTAKDGDARGISFDGTDTQWCGNTTDKLFLNSGKFTSTIKSSLSVGSINTTPNGIECSDINIRLNLWGAPSGLAAANGQMKVTITFDLVAGATSYNLYWDDSSPITKLGSNKIEGITSGYEWELPPGYEDGETYYFAVTAYNAVDGETDLSGEVTGVPYFLFFTEQQDINYTIYRIVQQASTGYYFVGCSSGKIFRSINSGVTWSEVSSTDTTQITDMCVTDNGYIYAITTGGRIYYSSNDGASFAEASANSWRIDVGGNSCKGISYSENRIYVVGQMQPGLDTIVAYSDNYGATWGSMTTLSLGTGNIINGIDVVSTNEIYVVTNVSNYIYKWGGVSWIDFSSTSTMGCITVAGDNIYIGEQAADEVQISSKTSPSWSVLTGSGIPSGTIIHRITYNNELIFISNTRGGNPARLYKTDINGSTYKNLFQFPTGTDLRDTFIDCANALAICVVDDKIYTAPLSPLTSISDLSVVEGIEQNTISWTELPGALSYNLYWSLTPGVTILTGTKITGVTTPYIHLMSAPFGVPYYYVVTTVSCGGESAISNEDSGTPEAGVPNPPTNLVATGELNQIRLTWIASTSPDKASYNIYWSLSVGVTQETGQLIDTGSLDTEYVFLSSHYVPHYFVVTTIQNGYESDDSNEAYATPLAIAIKANKLLEQYKPKPNINALINALYSDPIEELKSLVAVLYNRFNIDASSGYQLDQIGTIVNQDRLGHDDTEYRMLLKARICKNNSDSTCEAIIAFWKIVTQASYVKVQEIYPARINIITDVDLAADIKDLAIELLQQVVGAGIEVGNIIVYDPDAFGFGENYGGFGSNWGSYS